MSACELFLMTPIDFNNLLPFNLICQAHLTLIGNWPFRQQALVYFSGKWLLETTIWVLGMFIAIGLDTVSRPFQ